MKNWDRIYCGTTPEASMTTTTRTRTTTPSAAAAAVAAAAAANRIRKRFDSALRIWITMGSGSSILSIQQMLRKYRRHRLRLLRKKEYNRLRVMVPSIATRPKVSKVTVIEEAIKYIDQLHVALITRLQTRGLPRALKGFGFPADVESISHSQLRDLVFQMLPPTNQLLRPSTSSRRRAPAAMPELPATPLLWQLALQEQTRKWRSP